MVGSDTTDYFDFEVEDSVQAAACTSNYFDEYSKTPKALKQHEEPENKTLDIDAIADAVMEKIKAKEANQEKINAKKDEVKNLANEGKLEEAKKAKDELKELQDKFDILKDLDDGAAVPESKIPAGTPKDSTAEFAQAARAGFHVQNSMSEGSKADGGYTVPEDIQTRINKYKESKFSLGQLVRKESVKTEKGSRTFKKRSQQTGFTKVGEGGISQ